MELGPDVNAKPNPSPDLSPGPNLSLGPNLSPGPNPGQGPNPGPGPGGRGRTRLIVAVAVVGAVALLITGVLVTLALLPDDTDGAVAGRPGGPRSLREPIRLQQVMETAPPPCGQGTVAEASGGTCYRLGANTITVRQVVDIRALPPDPAKGAAGWTISVRLTSQDAAAFADLSRRASSETEGSAARQIAIIAGTEVISAPSVTEAITTGEFWITGPSSDFTRQSTERLIRRLTGP